MQLSDSLEVAIGLSFMFFLASIVLASVHEMIETVLKARGAFLFRGVEELLGGKGAGVARDVYTHPLIQGLMQGNVDQAGLIRRNLPSYVPTRNFALALIDKAAKGDLHPENVTATAPSALPAVQQLRMTVEGIANTQVRTALLHAIDTAGGDMDRVQANVEHWFDSAMDRVSGWYKRRSQRIIFGLGLATALALNVNAIIVGQSLSNSDMVRHALVSVAEQRAIDCKTGKGPCLTDAGASTAVAELDNSSLPVGWNDRALAALRSASGIGLDGKVHSLKQAFGIIEIIAGYLLTAFAVTLGAPFWFDILNRLMVIRATVKPAEKSKEEASQDPQPATPATVVVSAPREEHAVAAAPSTPPAIDGDVYLTRPEATDRLFESDEEGKVFVGIAPDHAETDPRVPPDRQLALPPPSPTLVGQAPVAGGAQ